MILKLKEAKGWTGKLLGLLGENKPSNLFLKTHFGIHTFGMKFPIDVLILDKNGKIVAIKENIYPNRFFFWNPIYNKVLELKSGYIRNLKIKIGDKILYKLS